DFYLQKGGDPTAQFAELAHKIRQAVTRRHAERSLVESEKRLADIINFLPDATFAIDTDGKVIAWNRAIEEMTGITAADMLGKGEYEYAVPFYGTRRRILIDLVFEPEKETREHYTGITREKDVLIAETDLPRPRGMRRTLMGKASPLYNRKGRVVGAIESIRDITQKKETEAALQEQNRVLARMNQLSLELAAIRTQENIREFAIKTLVEMTGAIAAWFCDYDAPGHILTISHLEVTPPLLKEATRLLGKLPEDVRTTVSDDLYRKIINSRVLKFSTLTEVSFGEVSPVVSRSIQALAGIDRFYGLAYVIEGNLYGTSVLALKKGQSDPSTELLESFAHIMAVSLSRRSSEERLAASEEKFRTVADYTYGWEYWEDPDRRIIYMSPSCERISGYSAEDFYHIPRLLDSIIDPSDRGAWENHRNEAETTTTALSIDFRIVRKDGGIRWINHICHPVFDTAGHPRGRRASNRDITEKKQKDDELRAAYEQLAASQEELQGQYEELAAGERRIRESEEKFRTFMEASIDGVILFDDHGGILAWNLAAEQIFGIPAGEAIGINIVDLQIRLIVPEHKNPAYVEALRSRFTSSLPELFSRDTPLVIEAEVMNARGHRMIVHQTLFPIRTSSGKRIGCILREITEQRNAEKNLMESEAKYRELAELLPQMVFEMDLGFRVTYANQIALTTMGVADKDLEAGVSALSFIDPSDHERIRQNIEKLFRGETVANPEYTAVRSDGITFPVLIYAAPISRS
ncbi:MAG: PAS domain S-box protein, partial [Methanoregulaceae archaeon]